MEIGADKNRIRRYRARRGAALMYALLAVFILTLITLAMGGLVTSHFKEEENAATYSRLIYSAEAAANWQLLQVSRTIPNLPDGSTPSNPGTGFLTLNQIRQLQPDPTTNNNAEISSDLGGILIGDNAPLPNKEIRIDNLRTWVTGIGANANWSPPQSCIIYAVATDPVTNLSRGVSFTAKGTGLADRFTIFGRDAVTFNAVGAKFSKIARGYIGSNGDISYTGVPPKGISGSLGGMRGCLLTGPQANLIGAVGAGAWPDTWDYPHLPAPTVLPTINDIVAYYFSGTDISVLGSDPRIRNNQPARSQPSVAGQFPDAREPTPAIGAMVSMNYRTTANTKAQQQFLDLGHITSLGPLQFDKSNTDAQPLLDQNMPHNRLVGPDGIKPLHIVRLHAYLSDAPGLADQDPNVFYFTNIQMRENDVLLLEVHQPNGGRATNHTALRIIIHNLNLNRPVKITNIAVVQATNAGIQPPEKEKDDDSSIIFYNDTNQPLLFQPTISAFNFYDSTLDPLSIDTRAPQDTDYSNIVYALTPGCPGLAYGIRPSNGSPVGVIDNSGSIVVDGSLVPCTLVAAIANRVKLIGDVSVTQTNVKYKGANIPRKLYIENATDPFRYVYFYHVSSTYQDINPDTPTSMSNPAYGYGTAP